LLPSLRTI